MDVTIGIKYIDVDVNEGRNENRDDESDSPGDRSTKEGRRYWLVSSDDLLNAKPVMEDGDKDQKLKHKILMLVEQTLHDTDSKINSIQNFKEKNRNEAPYKTGFILSMIKKSKDVLNELFNVAVKHREDWKALEQMKIFELIVHTNVDTTNLVRQLVEIHIQHMNSTNQNDRKRVVLIK